MKKLILFSLFLTTFSFVVNAQTDTSLQQYTGKYVFAEGSVVPQAVVTLENDGLMVTVSAGASALVKQAEDVFTITAFQGTATFKRNDAKKIIGVSINAMGYSLEGTKVDALLVLQNPINPRVNFSRK
jgi:hypothetical protein